MISEGGYLSNRQRHRPFFEEVRDEWVVVLNHQCDSWHIGSAEDVAALIEDLQSLLTVSPPTDARWEYKPEWPE